MVATTESGKQGCRATMGDAEVRQAVWARIAAAVLCYAIAAFWDGAAWAETRVALVAGNAAYAGAPLRNARSDAQLMSTTLKSVGFEVIEAFDLSATSFREAIAAFGRRIKSPDTVALFYYAGHGVQFEGENYLIPIGAGTADITTVAHSAVALSEVLRTLSATQTRLNIVILDACRDNPFAASGRLRALDGLAPAVAPAGTFIGYATAPGQVARDGAGSNSPYTAALAFNIPRPGATLEDVFRDTRRAVLAATGAQQVPWEHSSLMVPFYFKDKTSEPQSSAARALPDPQAEARFSEVEAWEKIKSSKDADPFRAHLAKFPNGLFAELAAFKLSQLQERTATHPWTWEVTGAIASTPGQDAAAAFERAVMLESIAASEREWRVVASLYQEAAEAGIPQAMYKVARAYDRGRGVARDLSQAAPWYREAAERGHGGAMAALGTMYEYGEGEPPNLAEALRLYRLSADKGDPAGMTNLGYLLAEGKGAARNPREARKLYERAAVKGSLRAQFNLALLEISGDGGAKDLQAAVGHLTNAAAKGHAGAAEELAHLYDEGIGVTRSPTRAAALIITAVESANQEGSTIEIFRRRWSLATKRQLQKVLAERGVYTGLKFGWIGEKTRRALDRLAQQ